MYKKLLLRSFTALSLFTLSTNSLSHKAFAIENTKKQECHASNYLKSGYEANRDRNFDFSAHLQFRVVGSQIIAEFAPQDKGRQAIELDKLAAANGYTNFNWVSYVEKDPYGIADYQGQQLTIPYNDPPLGGYQYDAADNHPFYWDIEQCQNCHERYYYHNPQIKGKHTLTFEDNPTDYRLQPGETIEFVTHLVGVKKINPTQRQSLDNSQWDILSTFKWQLTNTVNGRGQVSLVGVDIDPLELSHSVLALVTKDGGLVPQSNYYCSSGYKHPS